MSRVLITGARGFLGTHLTRLCLELGHEVVGIYRSDGVIPTSSGIEYVQLDLTDQERTDEAVHSARPQLVFHLAGQSSSSRAWSNPLGTYRDNVMAQVSLLEACSRTKSIVGIVIASSAEIYGAPDESANPLKESEAAAPYSPYGSSKWTQEIIAEQYQRSHDLPITIVRPFLQVGPGRSDQFFSGSFARQIVSIESGDQHPVITVGNLDVVRDMTDVRDVARAFAAVASGSQPGSIWNISSGQGLPVSKFLDLMLEISGVQAEIVSRPSHHRNLEPRVLIGDSTKLREATGWEQQYSLRQSAGDLLEDWRSRTSLVFR